MMRAPYFEALPAMAGHPELRSVDGMWMDKERYETEQWHEVDVKGHTYWKATLGGLNAYSRLLAERRGERVAVAQTVRERDDEFREYVDSLDDAKPRFGR